MLVSGVSASGQVRGTCSHAEAGRGNWLSVVGLIYCWVMFFPPFLVIRNLPNAIKPLTLIVVLHSEPGARESRSRRGIAGQGRPGALFSAPARLSPARTQPGSSQTTRIPHPCPRPAPSRGCYHLPPCLALPMSSHQLRSPPSLEAELGRPCSQATVMGTSSTLQGDPDPAFQHPVAQMEAQHGH